MSDSKTSDTTETKNTNDTKKTKKKKPFIARFFITLFSIILVILILIIGWIVFCIINRESVTNALPANYSVYVRTDSIWNAAEPLMDLKAADIILANPTLSEVREPFYKIRESRLRKNKFVAFALSRRVDAALYDDNSFLAIVDMGFLSSVTRLAPLAAHFINIENLSYVKKGGNTYFEYELKDKTLFIKTYKNLVIAASEKAIFEKSLELKNAEEYTVKEIQFLEEPLDQPFRIAADGKKLFAMLDSENENPYIPLVQSALSEEDLSTVAFSISDDAIDISLKIPMSTSVGIENPVIKILSRESEVPEMLPKLPDSVQYYTFITAGTLEELKDAAFTVLEKKKNIKKIWSEAESLSSMILGHSLEEILFSWTGKEYAVLGLEGKPDPVFAIKIGDEKKRQEIFDTVLSSIILKTDSSLLLDGIRLPRIEFPSFIRALLEAFNLNLSLPYYMVKDGFIYFSQSPDNLASMNAAIKNGVRLSKNEIWKKVSAQQSAESSISLYYNLDRSIPFFVKGNSIFSQVLQLYNIGRMDIQSHNNTLHLKLHSAALKNTLTQKIPGFPIEFDSKAMPVLYKSRAEKKSFIYWQQDQNIIKAFNPATLKVNEKKIDNLGWILTSAEGTVKNKGGNLWAVTKDGVIHLLNSDLEDVSGFPVLSGEKIICTPTLYENELLLVNDASVLIFISQDGKESKVDLELEDSIKASPSVYKKQIVLYEKGFLGGIHILQGKDAATDRMIAVDGIGYGSPCIFEADGKVYIAFISQSGLLSVWDSSGELIPNFPVFLDNLFYLNVRAMNGNLIALAQDGTIYRIKLDSEILRVNIPYLSAQNAYISIIDYDDNKTEELFLCGESNTLYGLNSDLEFLNGFPVSGFGCPAFADLNGDKKAECLALSIDNKLNAWKVR